jgi:hypothetical protein
MIQLEPNVEYSITAEVGVPMSMSVARAQTKCMVQEHEVIQYIYRVVARPPTSDSYPYEGQLVQVAYL